MYVFSPMNNMLIRSEEYVEVTEVGKEDILEQCTDIVTSKKEELTTSVGGASVTNIETIFYRVHDCETKIGYQVKVP